MRLTTRLLLPVCTTIFAAVWGLQSTAAQSQVLIAAPDTLGVPLEQALVVEAPGVMKNDLLDGEPADEMGATAQLLTNGIFGSVVLNPDGSFTYTPDPAFDGLDTFTYAATTGTVADTATVFLSACVGGPDVFMCWKETAFNAMAADLGYYAAYESFEENVWDAVRTPLSAPSITNLGVRWTTNHPDAPGSTSLTSSTGAARDSLWGIYDASHGYAEGSPSICDVDNPPVTCLHHDGVSGEVIAGAPPLTGIGGYFHSTYGGNIAVIIDDTNYYAGGVLNYDGFLSIIDRRPEGFKRFSFEEQDGKIGQALYIWADDFTMLTGTPPVSAAPDIQSQFYFAGAGPNPAGAATTWRFILPRAAEIRLAVYDARGRLVRVLRQGSMAAGAHAVNWNSRDAQGREVAAGTYLGQLKVVVDGYSEVQVRKLSVLH